MWIGGYFRHEVPPKRAFLTPRLAFIATVSIATWALLLALEPLPPEFRIPAAGALIVAYLAGLVVWIRSWSVVIERTHVWLIARPDLGDVRRVALFLGLFVGYGIVSLIVAGCALWLIASR